MADHGPAAAAARGVDHYRIVSHCGLVLLPLPFFTSETNQIQPKLTHSSRIVSRKRFAALGLRWRVWLQTMCARLAFILRFRVRALSIAKNRRFSPECRNRCLLIQVIFVKAERVKNGKRDCTVRLSSARVNAKVLWSGSRRFVLADVCVS